MPDEPNLDRFSHRLWREIPDITPSDYEDDYSYERHLERLEDRMEARRRAAVNRDPFYPPAWAMEENQIESEDE